MLFERDLDKTNPIENSKYRDHMAKRALSFGRYLKMRPDALTTLGVNDIDVDKLLDNLIYWHELAEEYEICQFLSSVRASRN